MCLESGIICNNNLPTLKENSFYLIDMVALCISFGKEMVYIVDEDDNLIGGITVGDMIRNYDRLKKGIVKNDFIKNIIRITESEDNKNQALDILESYPNINNIPVVEKNGKILYEIERKEEGLAQELMCQLKDKSTEINALMKYHNINQTAFFNKELRTYNFLLDGVVNIDDFELVKDIISKTDKTIFFIRNKSNLDIILEKINSGIKIIQIEEFLEKFDNNTIQISQNAVKLFLELFGYDSIDTSRIVHKNIPTERFCAYNKTFTNTLTILNELDTYFCNQEGICLKNFNEALIRIQEIAEVTSHGINSEVLMEYMINYIKVYEQLNYTICFVGKTFWTQKVISCFHNKFKENFKQIWYLQEIDQNANIEKLFIIKNLDNNSLSKMIRSIENNFIIRIFGLSFIIGECGNELVIESFSHFFKEEDEISIYRVNKDWGMKHRFYNEPVTIETERKRGKYRRDVLLQNFERSYAKEFFEKIYNKDYSNSYITTVMTPAVMLEIGNGQLMLKDRDTHEFKVINGTRKTTDQNMAADNNIFLMGNCICSGYAVEDSDTVSSILQRKLNAANQKRKWNVINLGSDMFLYAKWYHLFSTLDIKKGDIFVFYDDNLLNLTDSKERKKYDLTEKFSKVKIDKEFYFDVVFHCGALGYEVMADKVFEIIKNDILKKDLLSDTEKIEVEAFKKFEQSHFHYEVKKYADQVKNDFINRFGICENDLNNSTIGSIVMNCNPFTLGHQYLIEYAAKRVDYLLIFVVQEDKSYFTFKERLHLVQLGTKHLNNIFIVPSGEFILSVSTLPEYFNKETEKDVTIDTSMDLSIFGEYIVPVLNIKKRFVGEEPFDPVTRQYNEAMKKILMGNYNVEIVEIRRKESMDEVISASKVRRLLLEKKYEEIKKLVPFSTYEYLINKKQSV